MSARPNLTRELVLEAPVRAADGSGGFTLAWVALGTLWAEVTPGSGREAQGVGGPLSLAAYRITLRAAPPGSSARPKSDQRLREGTRLFRIKAVVEADRAGRFLTCLAEEELAK